MHALRPDRQQILDLIRCQLRETLLTLRSLSILDVDMAAWDESLDVTEPPLDLDSLERLNLAANVNRFFSLDETGLEDYLLRRRRLGEWADLIMQALYGETATSGMRFLTSGSTGQAREHAHDWASLHEEAAFFAEQFSGRCRIICLVPRHHVYGFLFGVMLPRAMGIPVLVEQEAEAALRRGGLRGDDLIVAFPDRWQYLAATLQQLPVGVQGVTSTAPCEPRLIRFLLDKGLDRMTEVHGSTETAGIGCRHHHEAPYELLPWWRRSENPAGLQRRRGEDWAWVQAPDQLLWQGCHHYRPNGRRDDVIQIGGVNVSPSHVSRRLASHEGVWEAAVRPDGRGRLKAFVVPLSAVNTQVLQARLQEWVRAGWPAAERPTSILMGWSLPRNDMGKLTDWEVPQAAIHGNPRALAEVE